VTRDPVVGRGGTDVSGYSIVRGNDGFNRDSQRRRAESHRAPRSDTLPCSVASLSPDAGGRRTADKIPIHVFA
jgi:hypothetical protein